MNLTPETVVSLKKKDFLSNITNKQKFLMLLSDYLQRAGCTTAHATGDADMLIVGKAIESSQSKDTVLIGDDTDLLVLLLYHADTNGNFLYISPDPKQNSTKNRFWNIRKPKEMLGPAICSSY